MRESIVRTVANAYIHICKGERVRESVCSKGYMCICTYASIVRYTKGS